MYVKFWRNNRAQNPTSLNLIKEVTTVPSISPKKEAVERAKLLLEDVGLSDRATHLPSQLSGGERQRIAVARSLINNPKLVLADEPTGNLDPANAYLIGEMLFKISEKYNKTLILVTHDMNLAQRGDVKYFIDKGQLKVEL